MCKRVGRDKKNGFEKRNVEDPFTADGFARFTAASTSRLTPRYGSVGFGMKERNTPKVQAHTEGRQRSCIPKC